MAPEHNLVIDPESNFARRGNTTAGSGFAARVAFRSAPTLSIKRSFMRFSEKERSALLAVKGVGPTVIARLEQIGFSSLKQLAQADALEIVTTAAGIVGSTCWKNSPQARSAIKSAIEMAKSIS